MTFSLERGDAGKVTFKLKYDGDVRPKDFHIYLLDKDHPDIAHAKKLIDQPSIPDEWDPNGKGIDVPYYPGSPNFPMEDGKLATGVYTFALVWSFGPGGTEHTDDQTASLVQMGDNAKPWRWELLLSKVVAGATGSAASGGLLNWWTAVALIPCIATGALGGALTGLLGYIFVWWFDAPKIKWTFRTSFLFVLFFTLVFSMTFGLLAIDLEREAAARGELFNRVTFGVSAVSAFLAVILTGILNNLRE